MNNPNDRNNKDFVMRGSDGDDDAINESDNQDHERTNESFRKWLSMPLILGAVGFLILNIIIAVFISSSTDSTGSEQIPDIEIRLDRIETDLTSIVQDIEELKSNIRKTVKQKSPTAKKTPPTQRKQRGIKQNVYKVQSGDSLSQIGQQYGLSVEQLLDYNRLEPNAIIHPGQELKLVP
ncbi:LysM peptidoglycan-binding domain-containing protein [bacterium]|nr:LysM peptidoglycan-binding domain-containing protein [bacterium]